MKYLYHVSVQPTIYYAWQLELWLHSFTSRGGVRPDDVLVVVHGNPDLAAEAYFNEVLRRYPIQVLWTDDHSAGPYGVLYRGPAKELIQYGPANKVFALADAWHRGLLRGHDYVVTTDPDMFIYGRLPVESWPTARSALADSWECELETFGRHGGRNLRRGVDLSKLLEAMRVPRPNVDRYQPGGVISFLRREDLNEQVICAMVTYLQLVFSLSMLAGDQRGAMSPWICSEMPIMALALAHHGVEADLIRDQRLLPGTVSLDEPPIDSLIHYAFINPTFPGSDFNKHDYRHSTPMDAAVLGSRLAGARTAHERAFCEQLLEICGSYPMERPKIT